MFDHEIRNVILSRIRNSYTAQAFIFIIFIQRYNYFR